jgi:hypothetical protein
MATFNTTLYNVQKLDRANPARLPAANQASGAAHVAVVPYELPGGVAATNTINLCVLPAGAIPIPGLSFVDAEDAGGTLTVDVGYASIPDALAAGITLTDGGHVAFTSGAMPADALAPHGIGTSDTTIVATVASAAGVPGGAKLVFHVAYKVPA